MTRPRDSSAGGDRLVAGQADVDRVIDTLHDALMRARLTGEELGARAAHALAVLTADIPAETGPAGHVTVPVPGDDAPPHRQFPAAPARGRPLVWTAAGSGGCLIVAFAAIRLVGLADPGPTPGPISKSWALPCLLLAITAVTTALFIVGYGVGTSVERRRPDREVLSRAAQDGRDVAPHGTEDDEGTGAGGPDVVVW